VSNVSTVGVKELLEAGVHFGHQTKRWNPKMKPFIFDARNGIHIIDLSKTEAQLQVALNFLANTARKGGKILFVGTKKQAQQCVKETAKETGQLFVTERWLGGTLTNCGSRKLKNGKPMAPWPVTANRSRRSFAAKVVDCTNILTVCATWTSIPPPFLWWT